MSRYSRALDAVVRTSRDIADAAPAKQGQYVSHALVYWRLIHRLRAELTELDEAIKEVQSA